MPLVRVNAIISVLVGLLLLLGGFAAFLLLRTPQEPFWGGEKVTEWLGRGASEQELLTMGAQVGPDLFPTLRNVLGATAPGTRSGSTNSVPAKAVLFLLQSWGPEAAVLLPDVLQFRERQRDDAPLSFAALHAAAMIAPVSGEVHQLLNLELRKDPASRANASAIIVLARIQDPGFVSPLSNAVCRYEAELAADRQPAREVLALSLQGLRGTNALPFLMEASENRSLRGTVLASVLELGTNAAPAAQRIGQLLRYEEHRAYWPEVLHVLGRLGPLAEPASSYVGGLVEHRDPVIKVMATYAAARIRERPDFAVTILVEQIKNTDYTHARAVMPLRLQENLGLGHREAAAWFLGEFGPAAKPATPELIGVLGSREIRLALFAARALARVEGDESRAIPVLRQALASGNQTSILIAAHIISEIPSTLQPLRKEVEMAMANDLRSRGALWRLLNVPPAN